jgi:DNA-binding MarR family transcriptional regulator
VIATRFEEPATESPGFLLWQVTLAWQREIAAALRPLELTHVQFVLLACSWWLGRGGEAPNQLDVAKRAGTDPKMTSEVLRRLEGNGLIVRAVDPHDTRARRVRVTDIGAELAARAIGVVEDVDASFFGRDTAGATATLRGLLARAQAGESARPAAGRDT